MRIWDAWFSGDPQRLSWVHYNLGANSPVGRSYFATTGEPGLPVPRPGQFRGGLLGSITRTFWGQPVPPGEKRQKYHVPLAGDIAQTSADLLFSKAPVVESGDAGNQAAFTRLMADGMHSTLLEAGELASALGGVYLRVVWDTDLSDFPWIDVVPADAAVPHFVYNRMVAVTFWRVLYDSGPEVVRHTETHVPSNNAIVHNLYAGDQSDLGRVIPLTDFPETAQFAQYTSEGNTIVFPDQPLDASTVVYVPNQRPNRIWRDLGPQALPLGRSDYSGVEGLMDALDETYSSWMRDLIIAKSRLIVPQQYLDNIGRGKGAVFDPDREVYSPINMLTTGGGTNDILVNQFKIRFQEHQVTASQLINQIVRGAGYSGQTFGEYDATGSLTATEVQARERRSLITREKKVLYWRPALRDIMYGLLTIQAEIFGDRSITPMRPDITFVEPLPPDQLELAQTAQAVATAAAASKETLVRIIHPDWTPEQVNSEVRQIFAELGTELLGRARLTLPLQPPEAAPGETQPSQVDIAAELAEFAAPVPIPPDIDITPVKGNDQDLGT
jgi:Phage portal protein, SPP1 Gp6-like